LSAKKGRLILAEITTQKGYESSENSRLRVVSNFGDGDGDEAGEYTRARNFEETRREGSAASLKISRARSCVFCPERLLAGQENSSD